MSKEIENAVSYDCAAAAACESTVTFTITADGVKEAFAKAAKEASKYARIPGFRAGKAPLSMVKARYGSYILEDVEKELQRTAFEKLTEAKDDKMDIVAFGRMDAADKPAEGADYKFSMKVEIAPSFEIPDYAAFNIEKPQVDDVEKMMADRLQYFKGLYADYKPIEGEVVQGDMLKVSYESDFAVAEDASPSLKHAVKADEAWLHITDPEQIPGMNAALTGKKQGDEVSFAATFPADWRVEELRDKTVNYKVKINDGQRRVEIQDEEELAKKLGAKDAAEMKEHLRKSVEQEQEAELHGKAREAMQNALLEKTAKFELPAGLLENVTQRQFSRIVSRLVRSEADVENFKKDQEKHLADAKAEAEKYLRRFFILRAIAKKNNIQVTASEIDEQIRLAAAYTGSKEADVRKRMAQNGGETELEEEIMMSKTLDFMTKDICK